MQTRPSVSDEVSDGVCASSYVTDSGTFDTMYVPPRSKTTKTAVVVSDSGLGSAEDSVSEVG